MYEDLLVLWKIGDMTKIAAWLNAHGIYSENNHAQYADRIGSYTWEKIGDRSFNLVVLGIMVFPAELRRTTKEKQNESLRSE